MLMRAKEFAPAPIHYFAYGMLTDPGNVPGAELIGQAILPNFRFEMFEYANVVPEAGSRVIGTLWKLDRKLLHQLDQVEEYPTLYDRKTVPVFHDGERYEAELYTMTPATRDDAQGSKPSRDYIKSLIRGYRNAGIPLGQIRQSLVRDLDEDAAGMRTLYHTSPTDNRESIMDSGLEPRIQLHTALKRKPGVYMFETLPQAKEWAYFSAATYHEPYDIWRITVPRSYKLIRDLHPEMDIYNAVIGYETIPPESLKLVKRQGVPRGPLRLDPSPPRVPSDITEDELMEGSTHPTICVDVQPEYSGINDGDENPVFPEIIEFVARKQTGPVLMFVNAEDQGLTGDTVSGIKAYWEDTMREITGDEDHQINWGRFTIVDKGYGYFRDFMDDGVEPRLIIKLIRYMYQKRVNDARDLVFPSFSKRTLDETELMHLLEEYDRATFVINWTSVAQLKRFNGAYIVGGGRNECLREVELLMNAFNIRYKRIDSLVYG